MSDIVEDEKPWRELLARERLRVSGLIAEKAVLSVDNTRLRALVEDCEEALEAVDASAVHIGREEYAVNKGAIAAVRATLAKAKEQS